ncbi:MAG: alpha/beta hydrolase [Oscillochloris sp.]|nr:alpha/beta hydrolase [Oscillochloris sp.]
MNWIPYHRYRDGEHTVQGTVQVYRNLESPQLINRRDLLVYLPPSYLEGATRRYPVLYMHDGQNLFDAGTSFAGEWCVDETLQHLATEGLEAIVVAIPNAGEQRMREYSPYRDARYGGGQGDAYLRFVIDTVRPLVEQRFRISQERAGRGIMGSSMGGLISLYAFFAYPEHFGFVGAMSPSLWFARGRVMNTIRRCPPILGRIYLDFGTAEGARTAHDLPWIRNLLAKSTNLDGELYALLVQKGYRPNREISYVIDEDAPHSEEAWARRLPDALRFLLRDL